MSLSDSERQWLRVRSYAREHHHDLASTAAEDYPQTVRVEGTPLLSTADWLATEPIPLERLTIEYSSDSAPIGLTGTEPAAHHVLPVRADGTRYARYSDAIAALARPRIFENRDTYRLTSADLHTGALTFGAGRYFDSIDVGDACAHEYAAHTLGAATEQPLRAAVGDPCNPSRRPTNLAISTLTLRVDQDEASFLMHRRDPRAVGHAAGMLQVVPVGIFQPVTTATAQQDFSLWRCMLREYAEELLGEGERSSPLDYDTWPFAQTMTAARDQGAIRAYCLGIGVDPLTLAVDLLAVVTIDAPIYDELFGRHVAANAEGTITQAQQFTRESVDRLTTAEPMQAAGAALLRLAWRHRQHLTG